MCDFVFFLKNEREFFELKNPYDFFPDIRIFFLSECQGFFEFPFPPHLSKIFRLTKSYAISGLFIFIYCHFFLKK